MQMTARKRHDHRTNPAGDMLGHYLLNGYLLGENYHPKGRALSGAAMRQPHHTSRQPGGGFSRTEFGGVPAQRREVVNHLDGYSAAEVCEAIRRLERYDPLAWAALEWHQRPKHRRPSRYEWALDNRCSEQTLSDRFKSAVRQVWDHLQDVRREFDEAAGR